MPTRGVWLTGAVIAVVTLFGTLEWVTSAAAFTILLYYSITNVAALRMNPAGRMVPNWVPAVGLVFCLMLAVSLKPPTIAGGIGLLVAGFLVRGLVRRIGASGPDC